jgi:hypothetical protein
MNKKEVLVIVLAFILAIVFANYMMKGTKNIRDTKPNIQVEDSVEDNSEIPIEAEIEVPVNAEETVYDSKPNVTSKKVSDVVNSETKEVDTPKIERLTVETTDYGVKKSDETGIVEITREFRAESPAKYSFRGYGVLKQ